MTTRITKVKSDISPRPSVVLNLRVRSWTLAEWMWRKKLAATDCDRSSSVWGMGGDRKTAR